MDITINNWQFKGYTRASFDLPVVFDQAYRKTVMAAGRIISLILKIMDALVLQYSIYSTTMDAITIFYSAGTQVEIAFINVANPSPMTAASLDAAVKAAVLAYAVTKSYTINNVIQTFTPTLNSSVMSFFNSVPQAAITDCPADAVTNYNVVTTLLGSLTGAVNTANTKQNQIATQFNSLLAELRTAGVITP